MEVSMYPQVFAADTEKGAASIAFFPDDTVGYRIH